MQRRAISRLEVWTNIIRSRWSFVSLVFFLAGLWSLIRSEIFANSGLPMLSDFMPWYLWLIFTLVAFNLATLEGSYRIIASLQPPALGDIKSLLQRYKRRGDELRAKRPLDKRAVLVWFDGAIADIGRIFSEDYAANVKQAVLRERNVRYLNDEIEPKHLIRAMQAKIDEIIRDDVRDENLSRAGDLSKWLSEALASR
jgi:hypothetical protein